jgi:hypothetical protein
MELEATGFKILPELKDVIPEDNYPVTHLQYSSSQCG